MKAKVRSADFLVELENKRAIKVFGKSTMSGLAITFFAGFCFSLFSPAFNLATNDQWHTMKDGVPHLSVYTAFFYFSVSCFVLAVILNISFLYHPVLNLPRSSVKAYLVDWNGRGWALLAGLLCGFGKAAGYTAVDAVQALPLVSSVWRVPKIIGKNIFIPCKHVVDVYCCCWCSHGSVRASQMKHCVCVFFSLACTKNT